MRSCSPIKTAATAPVLTSPSADSTLPGPAATFSWPAATGATGYELRLGSTGVGSYNVWTSQITTANSVTFSGLPMNGETIYAQLLTDYNGTWVRTNVTYTAATAPVLTSPAPGGALPGSSATFSWTGATGTSGYELRLGTTGVGSYNLRTSAVVTGDSVTFTGLPTNGETIYAQLLTDYNGTWIRTNVTYTAAASTVVKPALKPAVSRASQP